MTSTTDILNGVNLLDRTQEPTDDQLEQLMREVVADATARAKAAEVKFKENIAQEVAAAQERYARSPRPRSTPPPPKPSRKGWRNNNRQERMP